MNDTTVIILAAGNSERMGKAKYQLHFNSRFGFLDQLINQYKLAGLKRIIIVSQYKELDLNYHQTLSVDWVQNTMPEKGRSWSIYLGLSLIKNYSQVFIQNIDNPFTDQFLIEKMMSNSSPKHVVFPIYSGKKSHPVLIPAILVEKILENKFKTFDFKESIGSMPAKFVQWDEVKITANINTPEDYRYWFNQEP